MPRITVTAEGNGGRREVLFEESVRTVHVTSPVAGAQLLERLVWAVQDAEQRELNDAGPPPAPRRITRRRRPQPGRQDGGDGATPFPRSARARPPARSYLDVHD